MELSLKIAKKLKSKYKIQNVDVVIVCGSGLSGSVPDLSNKVTVPYKKLGMPTSKVKGHSGEFTFGTYEGKNVAIASRMHYYESGNIKNVRLPLQILSCLGAKTAILLTSCGGLNTNFAVGDIMLINDQINMSGVNPLVGIKNIEFTDMGNCYNSKLASLVKKIAKKQKVQLRDGVFCQMSGPSYETSAEVNMLRKIGADAVSMSTAHDCIIANYLKMNVVGFSAIVNVFHEEGKELTHEEVLANASKICTNLKTIISELIKN